MNQTDSFSQRTYDPETGTYGPSKPTPRPSAPTGRKRPRWDPCDGSTARKPFPWTATGWTLLALAIGMIVVGFKDQAGQIGGGGLCLGAVAILWLTVSCGNAANDRRAKLITNLPQPQADAVSWAMLDRYSSRAPSVGRNPDGSVNVHTYWGLNMESYPVRLVMPNGDVWQQGVKIR